MSKQPVACVCTGEANGTTHPMIRINRLPALHQDDGTTAGHVPCDMTHLLEVASPVLTSARSRNLRGAD